MKNLLVFFSFLCFSCQSLEEGKIRVTGVFSAGVFAIGGETTGYELRAKRKTYELLLPDGIRREKEKFQGKKVVVEGELLHEEGLEIPKRLIIKVEKMDLSY